MLARVLAAIFGGYALAHLVSLALVGLLPISRVDAVLIATQLSFAIYTAAIIWSFAARTAGQAWAGLLLTAVPVTALLAIRGDWP